MTTVTVQGIDVSHYQGTVNWPLVKAAGVQFAFAKATEGVTWIDPEFVSNWAGMKAAGILRGAYHFFEPNDDAGEQAQLFLATVQLESGDLPPVLDIETAAATTEDLWQGVETWIGKVQAATGLPPILYMSPGFADENNVPASLITYPLWVAEYGVEEPRLPQGWTNWLLWQSSQSGTINGVTGSVDLDQVNGSLATLQALVKT